MGYVLELGVSGQCESDRTWMENNCCGSCDYTDGKCVDNPLHATSCSFWASKGECDNNQAWMKQNCCRSCCRDSKEYADQCGILAKEEGACEKNELWMAENCCGSCFG